VYSLFLFQVGNFFKSRKLKFFVTIFQFKPVINRITRVATKIVDSPGLAGLTFIRYKQALNREYIIKT